MAIDAAAATVAEVKELVKANAAAAAERLKREGAYAVNVPSADAADADPIAQKYGECLLFGTVKKGVPKVTTAAFLPKPEFIAAVLMALGFTTNDIGNFDNFNIYHLVHALTAFVAPADAAATAANDTPMPVNEAPASTIDEPKKRKQSSDDTTTTESPRKKEKKERKVATENLSFGGGKFAIQNAVLRDCIGDTAKCLPQYLAGAVDFMTKRGDPRDAAFIKEYTEVKDRVAAGDVAHGQQWLLASMISNIPKLYDGLTDTLSKKRAKFENDPVIRKLPELEAASKFVPLAEPDATMQEQLLNALQQVIKSRKPVLDILTETDPQIGKMLMGRTCIHFPLACVWEGEELCLWFVAYVRFWLMMHSADDVLFLYYILSAFGVNSEFSAGNKELKKFADNIWAHPIQVNNDTKGSLCDTVENKNGERLRVLKLMLEGEQKLLSKSHDLLLGLIAEEAGLPSRFTDAQLRKKQQVEQYMTTSRIRYFAYGEDFEGDLLTRRSIPDELKCVLRNITKHEAIECIRRIHDELPKLDMMMTAME